MQNASVATEPKQTFENKDVSRYYDYTRRFYKVFWHGKTNALHYGYFDETTSSPASELLRMIEKTAKAVNLGPGDTAADLGCGVGGSAFWMAKNVGARVFGITLSESQCQKAKKLSLKYGLTKETSFKVGDYFNTGYDRDTFDVVFGVESLCYGQFRVGELAKEMFRITKAGGRIAVTDGFVGKAILTQQEERDLATFREGFVLNKMITADEFIKALEDTGFKDVKFTDWTENVLPTTARMFKLTHRWHTFITLATKLGLIPDLILKNNLTGLVQQKLFTERTLVYGCITAKK